MLYQCPSAYSFPPPANASVGIPLNVIFLSTNETGAICLRCDSNFQSDSIFCCAIDRLAYIEQTNATTCGITFWRFISERICLPQLAEKLCYYLFSLK